MKRLKKIDGCCAVIALHHVSGVDEDTVLRVCTLHGFEPGMGMEDADWKEAAEDLGLKVKHISQKPCRLRKFIKDHPAGLYLVGTANHLFVLDNGVVIDPRERMAGRYPGLDRIVKQAWIVKR